MRTIQGLIWDVDGTLIDSTEAHAKAWQTAMAAEGYRVALDRVRCVIGMGANHLLPEVIGLSASSERGMAIRKRRARIFREEFLPSLKPMPGAAELVSLCHERQFRMVAASSAELRELEELLDKTGVADWLPDRVGDSAERESKPSPDLVAPSLDKLGLPASGTLMIGATPYDIAAADRLGVATIAVQSGGWSSLSLQGALFIYRNAQDILEHFENSPLGHYGWPRQAANGR